MRETKLWSKEEEDFITENYTDFDDDEMGKQLSRSMRSVRTKRQRLGCFRYFQETPPPIKGEKWIQFTDKLEVSDHGRVRKDKTKYLKLCVHKTGYVIISINGKKRYLHTIVWEAFNGEIPAYLEVNHKDCNKLNNSLYNLEIITHQMNMKHAYENGCFKNFFGR